MSYEALVAHIEYYALHKPEVNYLVDNSYLLTPDEETELEQMQQEAALQSTIVVVSEDAEL